MRTNDETQRETGRVREIRRRSSGARGRARTGRWGGFGRKIADQNGQTRKNLNGANWRDFNAARPDEINGDQAVAVLDRVEHMLVRGMVFMLMLVFLRAGFMLMIAAFRRGVNLGLMAMRDRRQMNRKHDQISRKRKQRKPSGRPVSSEVQWFCRGFHIDRMTRNM